MKTLKKALQEEGKTEDEVKAFEKRAQGLAKKILGNFKDYEFYTGESMNPEGMVALLNYREDGVSLCSSSFGRKRTSADRLPSLAACRLPLTLPSGRMDSRRSRSNCRVVVSFGSPRRDG
jgi:hypothetical protein